MRRETVPGGGRGYLSVVFVADATTVLEPRHPLPAVDIRRDGDEEEPEEPGSLRRPFRTEPAAVHEVHANLDLANMDFEEFAAEAAREVDGVLRPFWSQERPGRAYGAQDHGPQCIDATQARDAGC